MVVGVEVDKCVCVCVSLEGFASSGVSRAMSQVFLVMIFLSEGSLDPSGQYTPSRAVLKKSLTEKPFCTTMCSCPSNTLTVQRLFNAGGNDMKQRLLRQAVGCEGVGLYSHGVRRDSRARAA